MKRRIANSDVFLMRSWELEALNEYRNKLKEIQIKNEFTDEQMISYRAGRMDAIEEHDLRNSTGEWMASHPVEIAKEYKCSVCGELIELPEMAKQCYYKYCPNCGADMRGEAD